MKVTRVEVHTVISRFHYDIPDEAIIDHFGMLDCFHEDADGFEEFLWEFDYDREDDWVTDRKGGYQISFEWNEE